MQVNIRHFRNLHERTFTFEPGLNMLSGNNGRGKSNTMAAIEWCLYGNCQGGSVIPWDGNKKVFVSLNFPSRGIYIERSKSPELFILKRDVNKGGEKEGDEYKDKDAEEMVSALFGSYSVWKATCFIPQELRCQLLSGTKEQQINTMNSIIFSDTDPSEITKKIDAKRKEEEMAVKTLSAKLEGLKVGMGNDIPTDNMPLEQLQMMASFFENSIKQMEESEKKRLQNETQKTIYNQQKERLLNENYPFTETEIIQKKESEVANLRTFLSQVSLIESIKKKITSIEKEFFSLGFTIETVFNGENQQTLNSLKMNEYKYQMYLNKREELNKKLQCNQFFTKEEEDEEEKEGEKIKNLIGEIQMMERNKGLLQCPSCMKALKFENGSLQCSDGSIVDEKVLAEKKSFLQTLFIKQKTREEYERVKNELDSLEKIEKPESSIEYEKRVKGLQLQNELKEWKGKISNEQLQMNFDSAVISRNISEGQRQIDEWKINNEKAKKRISDIENIEKILSSLQTESYPSKEMELQMSRESIKGIYKNIEDAKRKEEIEKKKVILNQFKDEEDKKRDRVAKIEVIKEICRKVQSERIEYSLESLNKVANDILKNMFEEPISIELRASKETKQGKVKNEISLKIHHNLNELTSLNELSKGQGARVSLALSYALFMLTPCPFIMLDEPFAPADSVSILPSIRAMSENLPKGRICIFSAHKIEGYVEKDIPI